MNGNTLPAIQDVIKTIASQKNYQTATAEENRYSTKNLTEIRRLARLFIRFLSTAERPTQASPYDVAEALLRIASTDYSGDYLSSDEVTYGLSQLPPERLLPDLRRSTTAIYQTILAGDDRVGRSDIIESPHLSASTYDRRIDEFVDMFGALGLVEEVQEGGYRRFEATITPWWDEEIEAEPPTAAAASSLGSSSTKADALFELAAGLNLDIDWSLFGPGRDVDEMYAAAEELRQWAGFLDDLCGSAPTREDTPPPRVAIVGRYPAGLASDAAVVDEPTQLRLTQTTQPPKSQDSAVKGLCKIESD